jgi:hypothetical protein
MKNDNLNLRLCEPADAAGYMYHFATDATVCENDGGQGAQHFL